MKIRYYRDEIKEAFEEIKKFQRGEELIIKTGRPFLDNEFPIVNGTVVTVAAGSGVGKSYELQRLANNVMDIELNPASKDYVFLTVSLEMKVRSLLLRALHSKTKKRKRDILQEEFTPEEQLLVDEYLKAVDDERQFITQEPETVDSFLQGAGSFLEQHKDKKTVFIATDHIALVAASRGQSKNQVIEGLIEGINNLKMLYPNSIWILLSQLNSNIIARAKDKDRYSQPIDSDIYYSGFTFQVSDYVVVIVSPYKLGIKEYSLLDPEKYPNLEKYFLAPDKKGRCSLETYGVLYYHLLKLRENEGWFVDIFAEDLNLPDLEQTRKKIREEEGPKTIQIPVFDVPNYNTTALTKNRGASFDNDSPF